MNLIGNTDTMSLINISLQSAVVRNRPLPHTLLSGAAGCGKTSTARHIAEIARCKFINIACDSIKTRQDVIPIIEQLDTTGYDQRGNKLEGHGIKPTIVFIDEIHGLSTSAQEYLGILMEEWMLPINKSERKANPIDLIDDKIDHKADKDSDFMRWSPYFTLIGATTNDGKLTKPFRDRFKLRFIFEPYSLEESIAIVKVHAGLLEVAIEDDGAYEISKRGRGVPRIIVSLLERCRDMGLALNKPVVTKELALVTFGHIGVDTNGLNSTDVKLLKILYNSDKPIGLENLSMILNESPKVLSETTEPYLIQKGLILRSPKGRILTKEGKKYLVKNGHIELIELDRVDIPMGFKRKM